MFLGMWRLEIKHYFASICFDVQRNTSIVSWLIWVHCLTNIVTFLHKYTKHTKQSSRYVLGQCLNLLFIVRYPKPVTNSAYIRTNLCTLKDVFDHVGTYIIMHEIWNMYFLSISDKIIIRSTMFYLVLLRILIK